MKKASRCVAIDSSAEYAGAVQPIDPSTAFEYIDSGPQNYPRYFNTPNQNSVAKRIADLEGAESGLVFSSGMAAISTTLTALLRPGDHAIFLNGLYGGSHTFVSDELNERGVDFQFVDKSNESFAGAVKDSTKVIYVESPTNPLLEIVDLREIAALANQHGITTVIDNTFASPIVQNPIELGLDVVLHSGTKYLGGHSDLCCGAVVSDRDRMDAIRKKALHYGGSLNAMTAYLLDRSLKTLEVRVRRQNENAMNLARFLETHEGVSRVHYPGLESHPDHQVAAAQMRSFGAMIAFELAPEIEIERFLRELELMRPALSLGGVETSMCVPATTSHRGVEPEQLNSLGITPQLIRLSVGIEDGEDLKHDFDQAVTNAAEGCLTSG